MTTGLLTWQGSQTLKEDTLAEMRRHRLAGHLVKRNVSNHAEGVNIPFRDTRFRSHMLGCMLSDVEEWRGMLEEFFPARFGIPAWWASMVNMFFFRLPEPDCWLWPEEAITATPVNLSEKTMAGVRDSLLLASFQNPEIMMVSGSDLKSRHLVDHVIKLYTAHLAGQIIHQSTWEELEDEADSCKAVLEAARVYSHQQPWHARSTRALRAMILLGRSTTEQEKTAIWLQKKFVTLICDA